MAKRELIDSEKLLEDFQVGIPILQAIKNNTITEEEIVKPYLEKLKSKIRDRNTLNFTNWQCDIISDKTYKQNFRMYEEMLSIVDTLIDNLLTEKGAEE